MSLGRAVATVGGFTVLSRLVGFSRDIVLSAVLGSGAVADAFLLAFKLPSFSRRRFAEGAFAGAFVPLFSRELQGHGGAAALAFARQAHAGLLLVLVPFSVLLMLGMPGVLTLLAPGLRDDAPTFAMAITFGRITFPYLLFISLASLYGGVLNSIDRFAHVAATPILLNLALIGAVLGLAPLLPNSGYAASIGVAIAGLLQWLWLLIACARDQVSMKLVRPRRAAPWIRTLSGRGRFGPDDPRRTASALAAFAVGLPAFVLVKALTPGFFAREDTRTPLYIATAAIVVNIALNIVFLYGTTLAQVGIALDSSISG